MDLFPEPTPWLVAPYWPFPADQTVWPRTSSFSVLIKTRSFYLAEIGPILIKESGL